MDFKIIPFHNTHWEELQGIYQEGIDTRLATFEIHAPNWDNWNKKFIKDCRIVCVDEGNPVMGWAAIQPVSSRSAYSGVAEVSVYVLNSQSGKGIGKMLLSSLIRESENYGFWMLTASIFSENKISIHLHEKLGFKIVGTR